MTLDLDKQIGNQEFPAKLKGHLIGGQWGFSSEKNDTESRCPSTGRLLAVSCAMKLDIKNAINCAHEHFVSNVNLELENRIERIKDFQISSKKIYPRSPKLPYLNKGNLFGRLTMISKLQRSILIGLLTTESTSKSTC